ncbi:MAG: TauD/TfdA family dioxygenase [Alphaproteobacteria bacterium]
MTAAIAAPTLDTRPLGPFGVEIRGVDLGGGIDDGLGDAIGRAFLDHQLLLFRDQALNPAAQVAFARRFGEVQVHVMNQYHDGGLPELYVLSNRGPDGRPNGRHPDKGTLYWHTDNSWSRVTGHATFLYVEAAPAEGGGTEWADMYAAYDRLDPAERDRLSGLRAVHNLDFSRTRRHGHDPMTDEQRRQKPPVDHPIVRTHPETGRKCLYLGDHAETIQGMDYAEGRALVQAINDRIVTPDIVTGHRWRAGDFVVWDNRCLLHRAQPYDPAKDIRVIRRCTTLGEVPH